MDGEQSLTGGHEAVSATSPDEPERDRTPDRAEPAPPVPVRGRWRGPAWIRVGHGLYRPNGTDDEAEIGALGAWLLVLPEGACYTHLTAAGVRGWWMPPLPDGLPVFISAPKGTVPQRPGLRVLRPTVIGEVSDCRGVPLAPPAETLLACARDLGLLELLVLIDCALHAGDVTLDELRETAGRRAWGARRLREAVELADGLSESAWETLLRILHVVCGIHVKPQYELFDELGGFVARGDLWLVGTRRFHEYDGGDHLERPRQRKDLQRSGRIDDRDWSRRGYTRDDVLHQGVRILREADEAVGREHDPGRIRAWHALLRDSLFSPAGTAVVAKRLGISRAA
jgi:hypothetical protein